MLREAVSGWCVVRVMGSKPCCGPMPPQKLLPGYMLVIWVSATGVQGNMLTQDQMWEDIYVSSFRPFLPCLEG